MRDFEAWKGMKWGGTFEGGRVVDIVAKTWSLGFDAEKQIQYSGAFGYEWPDLNETKKNKTKTEASSCFMPHPIEVFPHQLHMYLKQQHHTNPLA